MVLLACEPQQTALQLNSILQMAGKSSYATLEEVTLSLRPAMLTTILQRYHAIPKGTPLVCHFCAFLTLSKYTKHASVRCPVYAATTGCTLRIQVIYGHGVLWVPSLVPEQDDVSLLDLPNAMLLQELPVHMPPAAAPVTGVPFTASTEYDNQYTSKSLMFNHIGSHGSLGATGNSSVRSHKLPTVSSETTSQHFYPYWGVPAPQKKGYAVRTVTSAPALDFAGDTFTTTNAVEYQPKPSSYVRPTGTT